MQLRLIATGCALFIAGFALSPMLMPHLSGLLQQQVTQPYAGQQNREISSLSPSDIDALVNGDGWGLAKPAELNGFPGPAHVLELADKLSLEDEQRTKIETSFATMNAQAKQLGTALVEAEAALDEAFRSRSIDKETLEQRLAVAEELRSALRGVHLAAHLEVTPLLTDEQIIAYTTLRGYNGDHGSHGGHQGH
ncbi:MAG: Spy/CpxP family protein refolding chaperone [Pseudomonadota bacterium]